MNANLVTSQPCYDTDRVSDAPEVAISDIEHIAGLLLDGETIDGFSFESVELAISDDEELWPEMSRLLRLVGHGDQKAMKDLSEFIYERCKETAALILEQRQEAA